VVVWDPDRTLAREWSRDVTTMHRETPLGDRLGPAAEERQHRRKLIVVSLVTSACALGYAAYRGYYAAGGTAGMIGVPRSESEFQLLNLIAVAVLLVAALLPIAALPLWSRPRPRRILLAVCWVVAVGCVMHALIDDVQRVVSLAGGREISYPAGQWTSIDRRTADVQDLAFNEVFFLGEGLLWAVLAWIGLDNAAGRRRWVGMAVVAIAALTAIGLLSAFGVIGRVIVG
jgi:hypothetical protein